ncbi:hypothetical protein [Nonomuraea sp. NPDC049400]|uniref:hypothetical protein n=1 Tax=Nonomuraea sp. NPDC049400 TaxID=3364352 RepID=UPI003788C19C
MAVASTPAGLERHREREAPLAAALDDTLSHLDNRTLASTAEVLRGLALLYDRL